MKHVLALVVVVVPSLHASLYKLCAVSECHIASSALWDRWS